METGSLQNREGLYGEENRPEAGCTRHSGDTKKEELQGFGIPYDLSGQVFYRKTDEVNLELIVLQLNINPGYNEELLGKCRSLCDYMRYVDRVRRYKSQMEFEEAVEKAVSDCIQEGILKEFLIANRAEVIQMSIFEYNEELHMATVREEGREEGIAWERSRLSARMRKQGMSLGLIRELFDAPKTMYDADDNQ